MAIFCLKKIERPSRVGDKLKKKRQEQKLSLEQVALLTRVPKKYLQAIEKNDFNQLPNTKAHCLAYLKKYSTILQLDDGEITRQFLLETDPNKYTAVHPHCNLKIRPINSVLLWTKKGVIALFVILFISYLAWQINGIIKPPRLVVYTPADGYVTSNLNTLVQGETEKETTVNINGKNIRTNDKGKFEASIDLSKGLNTITITATKKHGKTTTLTRNIIVKNDEIQ